MNRRTGQTSLGWCQSARSTVDGKVDHVIPGHDSAVQQLYPTTLSGKNHITTVVK